MPKCHNGKNKPGTNKIISWLYECQVLISKYKNVIINKLGNKKRDIFKVPLLSLNIHVFETFVNYVKVCFCKMF